MKIKRCKNCGNISIEKITWKKRIWKHTKAIIMGFILLTSFIGTIGLYNFFQTGLFEEPNLIFTGGQSYAFVYNFASNFQSNNKTIQLTKIANELTKDCEETDEYCKAKKIFDELWTFDYKFENATNLDPIKTWNAREGDCDMMSMLMKKLLDRLDIKIIMSCSNYHCWNIIPLNLPLF